MTLALVAGISVASLVGVAVLPWSDHAVRRSSHAWAEAARVVGSWVLGRRGRTVARPAVPAKGEPAGLWDPPAALLRRAS